MTIDSHFKLNAFMNITSKKSKSNINNEKVDQYLQNSEKTRYVATLFIGIKLIDLNIRINIFNATKDIYLDFE